MLLDAHAHICDEAFDSDRSEVIARAQKQGVSAILAVGETLEDAYKTLELCREFPILKPCAGLYPTVIDLDAAEAVTAFIEEHSDELVAIGEVGLDFWVVKDPAEREVQIEILTRQAALSKKYDIPLNVHSRSAGKRTVEFLLELGVTKALMHAFDGKAQSALAGVEAGYFFSVPPSVVRSPQKQKLVRRLPLESLLLESDAPVLGPEKGQRNEPANVRIACEAVADLKGIAFEEAAEATTENAKRLFPKAFERTSWA